MHHYPRFFLNPMHNRNIYIYILEKDSESANKNHTSYLDIPE